MMETGNPSWKSPTSVTHYHYSYVNFVARETLSHCHLNPFSHDKLGNAMKTGGHISLLHFTFKGLGGCNLNTFSTKFTKKNLKKLHFTKTQNKLMLPFQGQTQNAGKFKQSKPNPDCWRPPRSSILKFVASIIWSHPYYLWDICQLLPANPIIHKDKSNPVAVVGGPLNNTETVQKLAEHTMSLQCSQTWRLSYSFNQPSLQLPKSLLC